MPPTCLVQVRNPRSGLWLLIDRASGVILRWSAEPFPTVPVCRSILATHIPMTDTPEEAPTYRIETLTDMYAVPLDRIDAFLADLGNLLRIKHATDNVLVALAESRGVSLAEAPTSVPHFTWVDDGEQNATISLSAPAS